MRAIFPGVMGGVVSGEEAAVLRGRLGRWSPMDLEDLALWLDATVDGQMFDETSGGSAPADGAQAKRWQDVSGLNRHLTSAFGPLLDTDGGPDGGRSLIFSGVTGESYLGTITDIISGAGATVYMVMSASNYEANRRIFDTNGAGTRLAAMYTGTVNGIRSGGSTPSRGVIPPIDEYVVLSVRGTTNLFGIRYNGVSERVSTAAFAPSNARFWLGAVGNNGANLSNAAMRLVGVVVADSYHDDATQAQVMRFLRSHHKAQPTKVNLICDGNSLTAGAGSTGGLTYPAQLQTLLGTGYWITNVGVGGKKTDQMIVEGPETVDTRQDSWNPRNWLVAWEGRNEMAINGSTPEEAYDLLVEYCQDRRAGGANKIVVGTMLPSDGVSEANRQTYNGLIRSNFSSFADVVADMGADLTIGREGDNLNLTYYNADKVHMTNDGYGIVAGIVRSAIESLT